MVVRDAKEPVAFAVDSSQRILYAERLTGSVRRIDRSQHLESAPVAHVAVSTDGQRGLLGLAVDRHDRIFVAYTEASGDKRLTVSRVSGSIEQVVWRGPKTEDQANGGHIAFTPSGSLVIGIGELAGRFLNRELGAPPSGFSTGRLLELDPNGRANQRPHVVSYGWHNPFAFVVRADGSIWVADNAPTGTPERLARGDREMRPTEVTEFSSVLIPTALIAWDGRFAVCTLTDSALRLQLQTGGQFTTSMTKLPCTRAAFLLGPTEIVFSDESTVSIYGGPGRK